MDITSPIHIPLSNNSQRPLSSLPPSPFLPPNKHPNRYANKYSNSNIDYLNNKLNRNTIDTLQPSSDKPSSNKPSSNKPSSLTYSQYNISSREQQSTQFKLQQVANILRRVK